MNPAREPKATRSSTRTVLLAMLCLVRIGLGVGVISLFTLALGAVGGLWPIVPWLVIILATPFSITGLWSDVRGLLRSPVQGSSSRFLELFVGLTVGMAFVRTLTPPTAWDALVYHLTGPTLD